MKRSLISVAALAVFALMVACRKGAPPTPTPAAESARPSLSPEQAAAARRIIATWLECEECESGELEAVVKLGNVAVPTLAATLRGGPSAASREKLRRHLVTTYGQLRKEGETHREMRIEQSEQAYVQTYMENYVALYQVRSAQALAAIGGDEARRALETAGGASLRKDVADAVNESLGKVTRGR
jgi:hypothetical protein